MARMNVGAVGTPTQKDPRHPLYGKRTDLGKSPLLELPLLGSPSPCPPGLYQGLRHSTGTRVGRQGFEESPGLVRCCGRHCFTTAFCLLPGCRGRGSCQRKWACIKASRKGQGPVGGEGGTAQAGNLPATQEWRHQAEEVLAPELQGTWTLRNLKPIVKRCGPLQPQVLPFRVGQCLQQQPSSHVSSQGWLGLSLSNFQSP